MYKSQIENGIHPSFSGLRKEPLSSELSEILVRLETNGHKSLSTSFLKQMGRQDKAAGFLGEVELVDTMIRNQPTWKVCNDSDDSCCERPCDVTTIAGDVRTDFQCKAILNTFNELWVSEFLTWFKKRYAGRKPGLILEFSGSLSLNEAEFKKMQAWVIVTEPHFQAGKTFEFQTAGGAWGASFTFNDSESDGLVPGITWLSAHHPRSAILVDPAPLRDRVLTRIHKARKSFPFNPSGTQFNFVLIDLTASSLLDEEDYFQVLYGVHTWGLDPDKMETRYKGHDMTGIFFTETVPWVSAVLFRLRGSDFRSIYAVYPAPAHSSSVQSNWTWDPFRFGRTFHDQPTPY